MKDKNTALGMKYGTAAGRLRKEMMFMLASKLNMLACYRCNKQIASARELSLDHKTPWISHEEPIKSFFDLDNIAFSHQSCNSRAASKPHQKYSTVEERNRAYMAKYRQTEGYKNTVIKRKSQRHALKSMPDVNKNPYFWTDEDKKAVFEMRKSGASVSLISERTGIACSTLYYVLDNS